MCGGGKEEATHEAIWLGGRAGCGSARPQERFSFSLFIISSVGYILFQIKKKSADQGLHSKMASDHLLSHCSTIPVNRLHAAQRNKLQLSYYLKNHGINIAGLLLG